MAPRSFRLNICFAKENIIAAFVNRQMVAIDRLRR